MIAGSRLYLLITLFATAISATLFMVSDGYRLPYTSDGATYMEVARNIQLGKGLVQTPYGINPADVDAVRLQSFEPGYPLAIAAVSTLGIDPEAAALGISIGALILLAPALLFTLRPLLGDLPAFAVGLLVISSPGHFGAGTRIYADTLFFLLIVTSLGLLFRGIKSRNSAGLIIGSGLLAAAAFAFRDSGIALLLAIPSAFVAAAILRVLSTKDASQKMLFWIAGVAPVYLSLLFLIPDKQMKLAMLFLSPEQQIDRLPEGPSLLTSARTYVWNLLLDLTGLESVAIAAWDYRILLFVLLPLGLATAAGMAFTWARKLDSERRFAVLTLAAYLGAGTVMVSLAIYFWDVLGTLRYVTKQSWIVLAIIILAAPSLFPKGRIGRASLLAASAIVLSILVFGRLHYLASANDDAKRFVRKTLVNDRVLISTVKNLPPDAFIVSTHGSFLIYEAERPVRNIKRKSLEAIHEGLANAAAVVPPERRLFAVILPTSTMWVDSRDTWQHEFISGLSKDYVITVRTENMILLERSATNG